MFKGIIARALLVLALAAGFGTVAEAAEVQMSFHGNQHFRFVSNEGKVILINPWVKGNKDAGMTVESFKKGSVDLILTTSGHGDDQGQAVEIAARTGATIFSTSELGKWMASEIEKYGGSKKQVYRGAFGGRTKVGGVTVQLIHSIHGSSVKPSEGTPAWVNVGQASGSIITFENGLRVLMAGSTGLTLDLQLFGMRYKPHVVMVPVMGRFMMHPDDAAFAVKLLMTDNPNLKMAIPQHVRYKGKPSWAGTGKQFEAEVKKLGLKVNVLIPTPGKVYTVSK